MNHPVFHQPEIYSIDQLSMEARVNAKRLCEIHEIDYYHAWDIGFHADGTPHGLGEEN